MSLPAFEAVPVYPVSVRDGMIVVDVDVDGG
jgi:nitrite reductase/ring-hydroxylating ferredoxin subunit